MRLVDGVHHLAICTADMKAQIAFFNDVLGLELVGLFWMHGVEGAWHSFLRLDDESYFSLVQLPGIAGIERKLGVTHAGNGALPSAGGTLQHLAFHVDGDDALLAMRDRIRSRGVNVFGPIDHGLCKSIYFAGPEDLSLEIASADRAIDGRAWVDPEVVEAMGISSEELARFRSPEPFERPAAPVAQPPIDAAKPHMRGYPPGLYEKMVAMPDEVVSSAMSFTEPPVTVGDD